MSDRLTKLEKLHAGDPKDPFLTYGIALEHGKAGRYDDAIAWLDKTLANDVGYAYAYFQKAKMLEQKGDTDAARAVLRVGMPAARAAGDAHAAEEMMGFLESLG